MSSRDTARDAGQVRRARPRQSLKMQAIGFLSRREHSRQELRTKLLDSLRKRAREDAALAAAAEKAAHELAEALREQPSNGIDDAFAPPMPAPPADAPAGPRGARASRARGFDPTGAPALSPSRSQTRKPLPSASRAALDTLILADGAALPAPLRARIAAAADGASAQAEGVALGARSALAQDEDLGDRIDPDDVDAFDEPAERGAESGRADSLQAGAIDTTPDGDLELSDPEAAVDDLLDWLAANNYLSETRFVESRVNARSRKQGALRIKLELSRHGLTLAPEQAATLRETEFARAQALWQRKFGEVASDARLRAKQARFLAARGFTADVVRRVVGGEEEC